MSAITERERRVVIAAYEVEADFCGSYKTWNPIVWFLSRAIALYLRNRAAALSNSKEAS